MAKPTTQPYRFVGNHADMLHSGVPLAVGDVVDLSADEISDSYNSVLLADGLLLPVEETHGPKSKSKSSEEES